MIYVTHDQVEAMTLADRMVILRDGAIEQVGRPLDLFNHPANKFVAGFLGQPPMNSIRIDEAKRLGNSLDVTLPGGKALKINKISDDLADFIIVPGGKLRFETRSLTGYLVENTLKAMRFDTVYFGADSVDPVTGFSTYNDEEAHQSAAMMAVSRRIVVLVDSTKFRAPMLHQFCDIERIDTIVTDENIPADVAQKIRDAGVKLMIAELNESEPHNVFK